jgi:hypothetical protein
MLMAKHFVIKEIGSLDPTPFAVVSHGTAMDGKYRRKVLFVHHWYETEDEARASAHRAEYPEY